jgi:4-amino-4-deoxy-L-arabinose transferase-like glycosyltransferase
VSTHVEKLPVTAKTFVSRSEARFHVVSLLLVAALTFVLGIISPPHLMDDVDGTQGQIPHTMITSGDWVTAHLDGVIFLDKAPLKFWITALLYKVLGVHDWAARIPNAAAALLLSLTVYFIGRWADSAKIGYYAGLVTATSIGLFLFTRVVIPDIILTLAITLALWGFLRAIEDDSPFHRYWAYVFFGSMGAAILLKGLIGVVFPAAIAFLYLVFTGKAFQRETWRRLYLGTGILVFLAVAAPWHVLAILRNPPYFDFTLHAGDHFGYKFRGFFWFYFINDQILRFTNERWPRDYNTVPRLWFWLYHLIWFFPWSFALAGTRASQFSRETRLGRLQFLCLIWSGFVLLFFTFSTTQEYYSMPIYPALALLIAVAMTREWKGLTIAFRTAAIITGFACLACSAILIHVRNLPTPGDISDALSNNTDVYTLSLGHMADLTFAAFAYLRLPLGMAGLAFLIGTIALWSRKQSFRYAGTVVMMVIFFQAARLALVTFDPYLSSYPVARKLNSLPKGTLVLNGAYYDFSSVPFYTQYNPLLLNGRYFNLEYGSYAPDAAHVFIDDGQFVSLWSASSPVYVITYPEKRETLEKLVGPSHLHLILRGGGKELYSNVAN